MGIEQGLLADSLVFNDRTDITPASDTENVIEEDVWERLQTGVQFGDFSPEEAYQMFHEWRQERLHHIGASIIRLA
jgi:hypothetical protein